MDKILNFLKTRTVGFWLTCAAALLVFVQAFVYLDEFSNDVEKMSWAAFALSLCGVAAFAGLSVSRHTAPYAPAALAVCAFVAFLQFVSGQIIYLSDVFYGGVTASAIASLNGAFVACAVLLILSTGLAVAGIFTRQRKKEIDNEKE